MGKYKKIILIVCVVSLLLVTVCIIPASAEYLTGTNVTISSLDYGFMNYGVPYLVNTADVIMGGATQFSPFFNDVGMPDDVTGHTNSYYSYAASALIYPYNEQKLTANTSYIACQSISFEKPVYKATFRLYLGSGASFESTPYTVSSFSSDSLNPWLQTKQNNYVLFSVYNIEHPIKLLWRFRVGSGNLNYIGLNISLAELVYADGTAELIQNDNANTDKITNNQNQNTDKVIQNQEENTDKILNGGSDEPPYSAPDTSDVDQMHETEDYIIEQTSAGRENAVSIFNSVGNVFNDTSFSNGMLFVSSFFNEFFGIPWLNSIGSISLALGAFAFVIGSVVVVGRSVTNNAKRAERAERKKGG